jgi:hypothetical protein
MYNALTSWEGEHAECVGEIKSVLAAINPAAAAAVVASSIAFMSAIFGPAVQLIIGSKQAAAAQRANDLTGSRAIATMRLAWMGKLRDTVSEFHSILMIKENVEQEKEAVKLSRLERRY